MLPVADVGGGFRGAVLVDVVDRERSGAYETAAERSPSGMWTQGAWGVDDGHLSAGLDNGVRSPGG